MVLGFKNLIKVIRYTLFEDPVEGLVHDSNVAIS